MKLLVDVSAKAREKNGVHTKNVRRNLKQAMFARAGVLILAVFLGREEFYLGPGDIVYAEGKDIAVEEKGLQAGLSGVVTGVGSMAEYYWAGQIREVSPANEEVLVGTKYVNQSVINRNAFSGEIQKAGELGAIALEQVTENQLSYHEYYTLLQIVEAEATGGDIYSKMLVANVVLNRVRDYRFPDTISDVVWETVGGSAQFSPTVDGRIDSCIITYSTVEAVDRVLAGEDNSQGALFFIARDSASEKNVQWFDSSLIWLFEYGGHEYYTFSE